MDNQLQTTNEQNYFLAKREEINSSLILSDKSFLQKSTEFTKMLELKKDPNFIFLIVGWIAQTSILMQIKNPIDTFIKQDIVNMLTSYWSNLSMEELIKAFELERVGAYNERTEHFQLFDSTYISKILHKYQKWKRELKTEHNITSQAQSDSIEISKEERQKIREEFVIHLFNEIKSSGYTFDAHLIYKELEEKGKLVIGNSRKADVYKKQYEKVLFQLKAMNLKKPTKELKEQIKSMEEINSKGKFVNRVVEECRALSVCEYLSDYLENINEFKNAL